MLSIIIVNYKNPPLLRLCLKSILNSIDKNFPKEIIVVDVSSTIETRNVISEFNNVRQVCFKENIGYTRGVNEGIRNSRGDAFLILNSDIIILKNSVEQLYMYLKNNSFVGMVSPQLLNSDGTSQNSFFRFPSPITFIYRRTFLGRLPFGKRHLDNFIMKDISHSETHSIDWTMGSAFMITKNAVDKIGLMDENLFLYLSDVDWPLRFWENGYKVVYYPQSRMYHYHKRDSKGRLGLIDFILKKELRWHIIDAFKYFKKHGITPKSFCS